MSRPPLFDLSGRRAFVTGSSRGIGRAIAVAFAQAGARVAVHGIAPSPALDDAVAAAGPDALGVVGDLASRDATVRLAQEVEGKLEGIDILVLNASVQERSPWNEVTAASFDHQVAVNLSAALDLLQAFVPGMAARGWGRVLSIGSVQEVKEHPEMLVYAASKAAQTSMIRNLARQLAASGVTCNNLAPGVIDTDRNRDALADDAYRETVKTRIPARSFGEPEDCVGAALLLCSDAGRYITGISLLVDGGLHL